MHFQMTLDDMWGQLESDLSWRQEELRLLSNGILRLSREADRDRVRRAQIVMLYAHSEGFCKVALLTYIRALNDLKLKGADASECLVALSFSDVFHAITYGAATTAAIPNLAVNGIVTATAAVAFRSKVPRCMCMAVPSLSDWNRPAGTGLPPLGITHIS